MISSDKNIGTDTKATLSTLWIFLLFNITFHHLHDFFRPGLLEEMMTGIVDGNQVTDELILVGSIMMEIPIAMVLLSRILNYRVNRWLNIIAGTIAISLIIGTGVKDLDDIFFAIIEVVSVSIIIWTAWKWSKKES